MHIIAPLMAGVAGAESGTATLYQRGTTTVANYYTDFEGTAAVPGTSIALDARGGASVYVNELVRVIVRSSAGVTIRDFVDGSAAPAVEVRSSSFLGAAYSGGAVAAGNPTTLKAVLDKWLTSAGSTDFNVLMNGASASLQTALAAVAGLGLYVVTNPTYGAVGDGVTNDTAAIQAAINAANAAGGGVVFFPGGTYRCAGQLTTYSTVTLRGVDRDRSVFKVDHDIGDAFSGDAPSTFEDLGFTFNVARTYGLLDLDAGEKTRFSRCAFTLAVATCPVVTGTSVGAFPILELVSCSVLVTGPYNGTLFNCRAFVLASAMRVVMSGVITGGVFGYRASLVLSGSFFDVAAVDAASSNIVVDSGGAVSGCYFYGQLAGTTFIGAPAFTEISESGNMFVPELLASPGSVIYETEAYDVRTLGTRLAKERRSLNAAAVVSATLDVLSYANQMIRNTGAPGANFTINFSTAPRNAPARLAVHNDTGASITYAWGTNHAMSGTTFAVAANSVRCFALMNVDFDGSTCRWHTVSDSAGSQENE